MAKETQYSEIKETVWTQSAGTTFTGVTVTVISLVFIYFSKFWFQGQLLLGSRIVMTLAAVSGGAIVAYGLNRAVVVKDLKTLPFTCPFCDKVNLFTELPKKDFDCEHCNRTVHFFDDGQMVPVEVITCTACRAAHRIPITVDRYICDQCNRPLILSSDAKGATVVSVQDEILQNYDVLLVAYDRRMENELAFKLQDLLLTNMVEARKLLEAASNLNPLVVGFDLSERKADAIRRELLDLGATAKLRTNNTSAQR